MEICYHEKSQIVIAVLNVLYKIKMYAKNKRKTLDIR